MPDERPSDFIHQTKGKNKNFNDSLVKNSITIYVI